MKLRVLLIIIALAGSITNINAKHPAEDEIARLQQEIKKIDQAMKEPCNYYFKMEEGRSVPVVNNNEECKNLKRKRQELTAKLWNLRRKL